MTTVDDDGEDLTLTATCIRCHGTGVITDGYTLGEVLHDNAGKPIRPGPACICHYPTDGPMGNPNCPAR